MGLNNKEFVRINGVKDNFAAALNEIKGDGYKTYFQQWINVIKLIKSSSKEIEVSVAKNEMIL